MSKLRDKALNALDIRRQLVHVPEWWGEAKVSLWGLGYGEYRRIWKTCRNAETKEADPEKFYPALIIASAHDPETNERIFIETDRDSLAEKNGAILERLAGIVIDLCGSEEEAEKNSGATLTDSTRSGSQKSSDGQ